MAHSARDPVNWSPFNFWNWNRYTRRHNRRVKELNKRLDQAVEPGKSLAVIDRSTHVHAELLKIHRWSLTYADLFVRWLTNLAGNASLSLIVIVPNLHRPGWRFARVVSIGSAVGFAAPVGKGSLKRTRPTRICRSRKGILGKARTPFL